ncbi:MAG TPA: VanW family protein [Firmicutes bacterium]|nr:VanW family protein [Candidatus Fermentithermobacillaceae bacterium]
METYRRRKDKPGAPVLAAVLFGLFVIASLLFRHEVVSGNVWAMGVPLGGLPRREAEEVLRERIQELKEGPIVFVAGSKTFEVSPQEIGLHVDEKEILSSLDAYVSAAPRLWSSLFSKRGAKTVMAAPITIKLPAAGDILGEIARALSSKPERSRYDFEGRDLVVVPASPGQVVTEEDVAMALQSIQGTRVEVPYTPVEAPESEELPALSLLAEFSTEYDVEDTDRNVNLALAAQAVHLKVLEPGQVYSFNKEAGERTVAKGYRYAMVVVGDRLEPGLAGGICQVTTTLFDAAALAGLDFPFVTAHGIPVEYVPPGMDAAVAWDYLDLKIKNNTDEKVVFGAWVEDGLVTVRVFGKPDGYTYEIVPVTVAEYPSPGKRPGLLVETYRVKKLNGVEVERELIMRNTYLPSYPPPTR